MFCLYYHFFIDLMLCTCTEKKKREGERYVGCLLGYVNGRMRFLHAAAPMHNKFNGKLMRIV